jgi:hypothetical protein
LALSSAVRPLAGHIPTAHAAKWPGFCLATPCVAPECHELGKKERKARLAAAVDTAYSDHWLSEIREKLAKPTAAGASLMPAEYVGKVVHKTAQEFGTDDDDTAYSGVVVSYSADPLKWTAQYDHGAPLTTEECALLTRSSRWPRTTSILGPLAQQPRLCKAPPPRPAPAQATYLAHQSLLPSIDQWDKRSHSLPPLLPPTPSSHSFQPLLPTTSLVERVSTGGERCLTSPVSDGLLLLKKQGRGKTAAGK